ncbi:MAG: hypothetical protein P8Y70_21025 [Candidatus Lokiarchaeota archaeon]
MNQENHPDFKSINKTCRGFLRNLKAEIPEIHLNEEIRHYIVDFLKVYVHYLLVFDGRYHNFNPEGIIRRFNQIEILIKAKVHIEGCKEATTADAKFFLRSLWIEQSKDARLAKLRMIPNFQDDWEEFTHL